ncbi:ribose 5-phosphate isomerase B [Edwardsiella ictaluri]|uniref:Ribose 5-phosphate isomerase B, putative n=2 Tax=Edwardsiella ictaluri TaxID=67780 RepID=C5B7C4_EDWI9|nr:ribose 5-phosphate isomerase B [Edwardsiella ictaluri]ACR68430.1 ribose 5-phosphate isomerase B, putative [Edwardsiella ictaluri 93-146]AVZ81230.1 ribose 5-phosphate isomerase B [Edwardsiella ictaluri]EKS7763233.1 ribose 5-phosphate isomerase B [Edwardsiella ictaluri]EKS7770051.1 ribose 5-phosphate isomerase B [Edwardsiella ictaluri]EKS7773192.1 ribose 5-phosphate isomerase B [Edwardsiella ictaluri]
MLPIAIGADDAAITLKETLVAYLQQRHIPFTDYTDAIRDSDYPDIAVRVAQAIREAHHQRGILLCGTGIGMSIMANKVPGIRAAQCHDTYSAQRARKSNDAHIITLGARVIGPELAKAIVDAWLIAEFEGGGSTIKVAKIGNYEQIFSEKYRGELRINASTHR